MAKPGPIAKWVQYGLARLGAAALTASDINAALHVADALGAFYFRHSKRHPQRIMHNLRLSFPEQSEAELRHIGEQACQHFAKLAIEVSQTPHLLNMQSWARRVTFTNMAESMAHLNAGKPALLVTGHHGNWEMLGYVNALLGYPTHALARPIDNPLINDWLLGIRQRRGLTVITKFDATDLMLNVVQSGGALGFVADQNAGKKGVFVPFFGRLASTYKSIGLLAIQQRVPIMCGCAVRRPGGFQYEIIADDFIRPEDWEDKDDPLYYVTARYIHSIERMARAHPGQYLWLHRRWKTRPRWETEGNPMPAAMEQKLESLPWMDGALMARLKRGDPEVGRER